MTVFCFFVFFLIVNLFDVYRKKQLTISFNLSHKVCQKTAAKKKKKADIALCGVNTRDGFQKLQLDLFVISV